jgi:transketolase N-terminal domain/subunit
MTEIKVLETEVMGRAGFDPLDASQFWRPYRANPMQRRDCLPFHEDYPELLKNCEMLAYLIRSYTVWEMRDVFYLSKCDAAPALYTALSLYGYMPVQRLKYYGAWESGLESHPDCLVTPGIEASGGSLGQIPGVAVGRALGVRQHGPDHYDRMVYVLIGDGECSEGSVWEAFMAAGHYKLDSLFVAIDTNKVQAKGFLSQDMSIEPLADRLLAFNFDVFTPRTATT